jgi:hypothetical protein
MPRTSGRRPRPVIRPASLSRSRVVLDDELADELLGLPGIADGGVRGSSIGEEIVTGAGEDWGGRRLAARLGAAGDWRRRRWWVGAIEGGRD